MLLGKGSIILGSLLNKVQLPCTYFGVPNVYFHILNSDELYFHILNLDELSHCITLKKNLGQPLSLVMSDRAKFYHDICIHLNMVNSYTYSFPDVFYKMN